MRCLFSHSAHSSLGNESFGVLYNNFMVARSRSTTRRGAFLAAWVNVPVTHYMISFVCLLQNVSIAEDVKVYALRVILFFKLIIIFQTWRVAVWAAALINVSTRWMRLVNGLCLGLSHLHYFSLIPLVEDVANDSSDKYNCYYRNNSGNHTWIGVLSLLHYIDSRCIVNGLGGQERSD